MHNYWLRINVLCKISSRSLLFILSGQLVHNYSLNICWMDISIWRKSSFNSIIIKKWGSQICCDSQKHVSLRYTLKIRQNLTTVFFCMVFRWSHVGSECQNLVWIRKKEVKQTHVFISKYIHSIVKLSVVAGFLQIKAWFI